MGLWDHLRPQRPYDASRLILEGEDYGIIFFVHRGRGSVEVNVTRRHRRLPLRKHPQHHLGPPRLLYSEVDQVGEAPHGRADDPCEIWRAAGALLVGFTPGLRVYGVQLIPEPPPRRRSLRNLGAGRGLHARRGGFVA